MSDTTELREQLADVLMTPNQSWRGMKKIPIELLWGLEDLIERQVLQGRLDEIQKFRQAMTFDHATPSIYAPERIKDLQGQLTETKT